MTLPYDYARCAGKDHINCKTCARRTPGHPERQAYMAPTIDEITGECSWRIGIVIPPAPNRRIVNE